MGTYHLAYKGGAMPETEDDRNAQMAAWGAFFGGIGDAVIDAGNPFGASMSIASSGAVSEGASSGISGYSVISAGSLADATATAKTCPILGEGGTVEVHEIHPVM